MTTKTISISFASEVQDMINGLTNDVPSMLKSMNAGGTSTTIAQVLAQFETISAMLTEEEVVQPAALRDELCGLGSAPSSSRAQSAPSLASASRLVACDAFCGLHAELCTACASGCIPREREKRERVCHAYLWITTRSS